MKVLVIGMNGLGLAPTTPGKARRLLKDKRATVVCRQPFTIRLKYKTGCAHPELTLGEDTGSQHIGFAIVEKLSEDSGRVLDKAEYRLRPTMEKRALLEKRATYRRGRRYRKTRYRHPKYKIKTKRIYCEEPVKRNGHMTHWKKETGCFNTNRPEGWLPPTIQSKVDQHIRLTKRYINGLPPDTVVRIEVGRFDVQHMENPEIRGKMYQQGSMYEYENVKAYVFARDNYTCRCCGKKAGTKRNDGSTVKLVAHHIDFKSKGASDNPKRMATVCDKCHTTAAHWPGGILYEWMISGKEFKRGYRDTTVMNIVRRRIFDAFPDAEYTYGNITAADRKQFGLKKTHCNDAAAIAAHGMEHVEDTDICTYYDQMRKQKRSLHEAVPRKGRKEPNRTAKRNAKNTCHAGNLYLNDKVTVFGQTGWISGFSGKSSVYVKDQEGHYITVPGKSHKLIPVKAVCFRTHCNNWAVYTTKTIVM